MLNRFTRYWLLVVLLVAVLVPAGCRVQTPETSLVTPEAAPFEPTPRAEVQPTPTSRPRPTVTLRPTAASQPTLTTPPLSPEEAVAPRASAVIHALRGRDMETVASYVHPRAGLRFSPYGFVQDAHLALQADRVQGLLADQTRYVWGVYDGSGLPIEATFDAYYDEFIYDADFADAEEVSYNRRIGQGNTIDNTQQFYPGAVVVEYHFPGFDPQYAGMDWRSLRLVFQEMDGVWYLVGIVHDEWTI